MAPSARHGVQWGLEGHSYTSVEAQPGALSGTSWNSPAIRHSYTSVEAQPGAQLLWAPDPRHTLWASVARALPTSSRFEREGRVSLEVFPGPGGTPNLLALFGWSEFRSETLRAQEAGYRWQAGPRFSLDLAAFYNVCRGPACGEPSVPYLERTPVPAHMLIPLRLENALNGCTYGAEATARWKLLERWQVHGGNSRLHLGLRPAGSAGWLEQTRAEQQSPRHQAHVRSYLDLPGRLSWDAALYCTGAPGAVVVGATRSAAAFTGG